MIWSLSAMILMADVGGDVDGRICEYLNIPYEEKKTVEKIRVKCTVLQDHHAKQSERPEGKMSRYSFNTVYTIFSRIE